MTPAHRDGSHVIDCVGCSLDGPAGVGRISVSADGAKLARCRNSGRLGPDGSSGGRNCPFLGLGSFGNLRFGGRGGTVWSDKAPLI